MTEADARKRAVVIYGAQGSGKTTLARQMAAAAGSFVEVPWHWLAEDSLALGSALGKFPAALIVDEVPAGALLAPVVSKFLSGERLLAHRAFRAPVEIDAPLLILCMAAGAAPRLDPRRFRLIETRA